MWHDRSVPLPEANQRVELYFPFPYNAPGGVTARIAVTMFPERVTTLYEQEWTHWRFHEEPNK